MDQHNDGRVVDKLYDFELLGIISRWWWLDWIDNIRVLNDEGSSSDDSDSDDSSDDDGDSEVENEEFPTFNYW